MNTLKNVLDTVTIEEVSRGYTVSDRAFTCLSCGKEFSKQQVFPSGSRLLMPKAAIESHIEETHSNYLLTLLEMDKDIHGISQAQAEILTAAFLGKTDKQTARDTGRTESAVRNMRFQLKRKTREARVFLGIMNHLNQKEGDDFISFNGVLTVHDDRTIITKAEETQIRNKYFDDNMHLSRFPKKEKEKLVLLNTITEQFRQGTTYTEKEMNTILKGIHEDYVTIRRYLIEYGFMDRTPDGKSYWRK